MKFSTTIYNFNKQKGSLNNKIAYSAFGIVLICSTGIIHEIIPSNFLTKSIMIIGVLFPIIILRISALVRKEEHTKEPIGVLEINTDKLKWNERQILWEEVEEIDISAFDYNERFINKRKGDFSNNLSNGLDNEIVIRLTDSTKYKGNFLIESKGDIKKLKNILWEVVKKNKTSLENARNMIGPKNYKEHQEIKKYCR